MWLLFSVVRVSVFGQGPAIAMHLALWYDVCKHYVGNGGVSESELCSVGILVVEIKVCLFVVVLLLSTHSHDPC